VELQVFILFSSKILDMGKKLMLVTNTAPYLTLVLIIIVKCFVISTGYSGAPSILIVVL